MTPVSIVSMPHNGRAELYPEGEGPSFDAEHEPGTPRLPCDPVEWASLPIQMPETLTLLTDATGRPIAAWADDAQIRWRDLDVVLTGVEQYNRDLASRDPDNAAG
jgi:hypothetical protein